MHVCVINYTYNDTFRTRKTRLQRSQNLVASCYLAIQMEAQNMQIVAVAQQEKALQIKRL